MIQPLHEGHNGWCTARCMFNVAFDIAGRDASVYHRYFSLIYVRCKGKTIFVSAAGLSKTWSDNVCD